MDDGVVVGIAGELETRIPAALRLPSQSERESDFRASVAASRRWALECMTAAYKEIRVD